MLKVTFLNAITAYMPLRMSLFNHPQPTKFIWSLFRVLNLYTGNIANDVYPLIPCRYKVCEGWRVSLEIAA
jgi:hypothetical protein